MPQDPPRQPVSRPTPPPVAPSVSLRIDFGTGARVGPGKIALIEAVGRAGSISAAGRELGMSYRRAWMLLDALNRSFDTPVVATTTGGAKGGGAVVTAFGADLVSAYRGLEAHADTLAAAALSAVAARLSPNPGGAGAEDDG